MSTAAPTRKQAREAARQERRRREHEAELKAARQRRLMWLGGILVALVAAAAITIAATSGGGKKNAASGGGLKDVSLVAAAFAGIPQTGNVLGNPNAKATLMVFADMQCPVCAEFENQAMPALLQRYVRPGKLKINFQPITILGPESTVGARMVSAAGLQNKEFQFASLWYHNQGTENTGYVTNEFLKRIAGGVRGLDVPTAFADMKGPRVDSIVAQAASAARTGGVNATPTFLVARKGQSFQQFQVSSLSPSAFYGELDAATR